MNINQNLKYFENNFYIYKYYFSIKFYQFKQFFKFKQFLSKKIFIAILLYKTFLFNVKQVDENGKIHRLRRECPMEQCGAGVFMAAMEDRHYCGKCGYTLVFNKPEDK